MQTDNEESEELAVSLKEASLESVLKQAGNNALNGMHARRALRANAEADAHLYDRVLTNDDEFDLFASAYLEKPEYLTDDYGGYGYSDLDVLSEVEEEEESDMDGKFWKDEQAAAVTNAYTEELELEIGRAEDTRISTLRDEERLWKLWTDVQATSKPKPEPKRLPLEMKPKPKPKASYISIFDDRKLNDDIGTGSNLDSDESYYESLWQEWISWFTSLSPDDASYDTTSTTTAAAAHVRRLAPKPKPPSKLYPAHPTTDDVDSPDETGYSVAAHGYSNSTAEDGQSTGPGDGYNSNRTGYFSGNSFNDYPVETAALIVAVSLAIAGLIACYRSKLSGRGYAQANGEDTTHNDNAMELLESGAGVAAGQGQGKPHEEHNASMPSLGSGKTKKSPFQPNRPTDAEPPTDTVNASDGSEDNQLPSSSVLTPLDIQVAGTDGLYNEAPVRDSSVWGWGKSQLHRLLRGGVEYKLAPEVAEMVFGNVSRCSSSATPNDHVVNEKISTNVTITISTPGENEELSPVPVDKIPPFFKTDPQDKPYNLSELSKSQAKDFIEKSSRRRSSTSSTAGTTCESAYSIDEGRESPHSRSKCASLRAFTSDVEPLEDLIEHTRRVLV